ncbi:MAG TPA: sulfatase-like hydrolase/transferase, partial [Acidimicrobiia bacterium]|nr:sulfatase-like hydrolase/transferase [Acidimicrobiia bacterium]
MKVAPAATARPEREAVAGVGETTGVIAPLTAAVGALGALAVAQPVLELIGREPGFLVAHEIRPVEIYLIPIILVGVPLVVGLLIALLWRLAPRAGSVAASCALGLGGTALTLQLLRRVPVPTSVLIALSVAAGGFGAWAFMKHAAVRSASRALLVMPVLVVAWFILVLPASLRAGAAEGWPSAIIELDRPVPIVVLILDEFPVTSLMDADANLLEEAFPSFARLAADGVWYRNAVTVETSTQRAVPAILTGKRVAVDLIPTVADHPQSLFTLLSVTHDIQAFEPVTGLCPASVCVTAPPSLSATVQKWRRFLSDLSVVYGHVALPPSWTTSLPPIDQGWTDFRRRNGVESGSFDLMDRVAENVEGDRRADIERFLTALAPDEDTDRPSMTVAHLVLPHRPWEYLPDGRPHGEVGTKGYNGLGWGPDPYFTAAGWRRHLLQLGFVDNALGRTLDRLEESGLYDSTLFVVVADHGVVFDNDVGDMRVTRPESVGWILPVPLFIKYPDGLGAGTITDVRAETTDIVPTILDVLGADAPGDLEGASLLGSVPAGRTESRALVRG